MDDKAGQARQAGQDDVQQLRRVFGHLCGSGCDGYDGGYCSRYKATLRGNKQRDPLRCNACLDDMTPAEEVERVHS